MYGPARRTLHVHLSSSRPTMCTGPYESYAVIEEPTFSVPVEDDARSADARCASGTNGLDLQPLLNCVLAVAGESVALKLDLSDRDARIAAFKAELHWVTEKMHAVPDLAPDLTAPPSISGISHTKAELLRQRVAAAK